MNSPIALAQESVEKSVEGKIQESPEIIAEKERLEAVANGDDGVLAMDAANRLASHYRVSGDAEKSQYWQKKLIDILQQRAEKGEVDAMNFWATMYTQGSELVPQDFAKARGWFEKAAEAGDSGAQYKLATFYLSGTGGPADKAKAAYWFTKARELMEARAAQGDMMASFWVGQIYFHGLGTKVDYHQSFEYFLRAAKLGDIRSQVLVAFMYREGKGCEANEKESLEWFKKAADQGDVGAIMEVALSYREGKGVEKDPAEARKWLLKGAERDDFYALRTLAIMYDHGEGGEKDDAKALEYYEKAAHCGDIYSLLEAVDRLKKINPDQAQEFLRKASYEYHSPAATYELALMEKGRGDSKMAAKLLEESASGGYTPAMIELGKMHVIPFSGAKWNPRISHYWWSIAEKRGDAEASTCNAWLLWGGGGLVLVIVVVIILLLNSLIKRKLKEQDAIEAEMTRNSGSKD